MKWFDKEIVPLRHPYNCTANDSVYDNDAPDRLSKVVAVLKAIRSWILRSGTDIRSTERSIEIPLALNFLSQLGELPVLELGCVLPYYVLNRPNHKVVDLMDPHPTCDKIDIRNIADNEYETNIISISTLEHIGLGDYGISQEGLSAEIVLSRILQRCHKYFISFPLGVNQGLESHVFSNMDSLMPIFVRRKHDNKLDWETVEASELLPEDKTYNTFCCANTICVLTNLRQ